MTTRKAPLRLKMAQALCRRLPPLISQRVRTVLYPQKLAFADSSGFLTRAQTGSLFAGSTGDFHAYPFAVHGYYEWRNWAVALAVCSPGDTIVEVGANIGTETIGFRDIVRSAGWVHAFEPMPANVHALRNLVQINGWTNVVIHPIALGAEHAETEFVLPEHDWASGVGHLRGPAEQARKTVRVKVAPMDSMKHDIGTVRALFIDTEGAEVDVLRGGAETISGCRPVIVLEASPKLLARAGRTTADLCGVLADLGYMALEVTRLGLARPTRADMNRAANWVCLPSSAEDLVPRIRRCILLCGLLPCIARVNPMTRRPRCEWLQILHRR